jgi:hypothetical protein
MTEVVGGSSPSLATWMIDTSLHLSSSFQETTAVADPKYTKEERKMLAALEVCLNGACVWKDQTVKADVVKVVEEVKNRVCFTDTEQRIMNLLKDGRPHEGKELRACLEDDLADRFAYMPHVRRLVKKVQNLGKKIVCHDGRKGERRPTTYQMIDV